MPCFHPLLAWQPANGGQLAFKGQHGHSPIEISCGQCIGCRVDRATDWGVRITHESKLYDHNAWVTLTYAENPVSLVKSHLQDFHRALRQGERRRKKDPPKIRYFGVGEYGEKLLRPHYHTALFNYWPHDAKRWDKESFRSDYLDKIWGRGMVDIRMLNWERAVYLGKYSMKKIGGEPAKNHYTRFDPSTGEFIEVTKEFATMSLKPGIGHDWYTRFVSDYLPCDNVVLDGRKRKVPKAYWRKFSESDPETAELVKTARKQALEAHAENITDARLKVREEVAKLKSQSIQRKI